MPRCFYSFLNRVLCVLIIVGQGRVQRIVKWHICCTGSTLRASLSGTFLRTLPDLVTPLEGYSLSTRSCQPTRSASSEKFGYFGVTKYGSGWMKDVVNLCLEFVPALVSFLWTLIRSAAGSFKEVAVTDQKTPLSLWPGRSLRQTGHAGTMAFQSLSIGVSGPANCHPLRKPLNLKIRHKNIYYYHWGAVWKSRWPYWAPRP